eukprot:6184235-Pleurochrysis_carterae.AAC.3
MACILLAFTHPNTLVGHRKLWQSGTSLDPIINHVPCSVFTDSRWTRGPWAQARLPFGKQRSQRRFFLKPPQLGILRWLNLEGARAQQSRETPCVRKRVPSMSPRKTIEPSGMRVCGYARE